MKQTVSIFAPDINIASKSSAIQLWLNRKNQFFSSVLEEGVSNRQVLLLGHASFVFSALICASFVSQVPALICLSWFMVALRLCVKEAWDEVHYRAFRGSRYDPSSFEKRNESSFVMGDHGIKIF